MSNVLHQEVPSAIPIFFMTRFHQLYFIVSLLFFVLTEKIITIQHLVPPQNDMRSQSVSQSCWAGQLKHHLSLHSFNIGQWLHSHNNPLSTFYALFHLALVRNSLQTLQQHTFALLQNYTLCIILLVTEKITVHSESSWTMFTAHFLLLRDPRPTVNIYFNSWNLI